MQLDVPGATLAGALYLPVVDSRDSPHGVDPAADHRHCVAEPLVFAPGHLDEQAAA